MTPGSEPPLTTGELLELAELQMKGRGQTWDDLTRSTRARLEALRLGQAAVSPRESGTSQSVESRLSELEAEVKRLRELLEGGPKNG
jgi:hypothetical protein